MMNPEEIKDKGKRIVVDQLKRKGWSQVNATRDVPNPADVVAAHQGKAILISITPTILPKTPQPLDPGEKEQVKAMAMQNNAQAYQVKMTLNENMRDIERIAWVQL